MRLAGLSLSALLSPLDTDRLSAVPVPSQRRSLALRAQISNLAAADDPDALYAITVDSKRLVLLCRPSTPKREQLRERAIAARDRAIKTQAAEAIGECERSTQAHIRALDLMCLPHSLPHTPRAGFQSIESFS